LRLLVIIYGIYLALAVLVVSPLLNFWPAKYVQDNYQRELQTRWVYFNPLTLSLNLSEGSLKEPNGDAFLGLGKTSINLSLESIWQPGIVFDEIHLEDVSLTIVHLEDGRFNFSSLLPADEELGDKPAATEGETFPITIHSFYLQASNLNLGDDERTPPYRGEWKDLSLAALDFSTIKENHELYRFDITSPRGGKFSWEGQLSVLSASSSGRLEAKTLSMVEIGRAAEPWINFSTLSGDLGLELEYAVSWKEIWKSQKGIQIVLLKQDLGWLPLIFLPLRQAARPNKPKLATLQLTGLISKGGSKIRGSASPSYLLVNLLRTAHPQSLQSRRLNLKHKQSQTQPMKQMPGPYR
jgi:hypothetical protein